MKAELATLKQTPFLDAPATHAVYDAAVFIDASDPDFTWMDFRIGESRDLPVFLRGNVATPGPITRRRFLQVLSPNHSPTAYGGGSGRLELARSITTTAAPLAARVFVNRVWGWHFGRPLVTTTSDFGAQGEKPTHPRLLDDLAAAFIANGWSLKWLHREILLSAPYAQSSRHRPDPAGARPGQPLDLAIRAPEDRFRDLAGFDPGRHRLTRHQAFRTVASRRRSQESPADRLLHGQPPTGQPVDAALRFPRTFPSTCPAAR
ncbi:MAG: hypothetical protein CM1200mP2_26300 [Planctomycetaceae bacterium]|nr:MAG: hypothetical protein CM1200mP2_26300 [Planctomycetaceae bacterium]